MEDFNFENQINSMNFSNSSEIVNLPRPINDRVNERSVAGNLHSYALVVLNRK